MNKVKIISGSTVIEVNKAEDLTAAQLNAIFPVSPDKTGVDVLLTYVVTDQPSSRRVIP